jgi:hypothetical protein
VYKKLNNNRKNKLPTNAYYFFDFSNTIDPMAAIKPSLPTASNKLLLLDFPIDIINSFTDLFPVRKC